MTLGNMAEVCNRRGNYSKSLKLNEEALGVFKAAYGPVHRDVGECLRDREARETGV